jgi:hypothetical protein
VGRLRARQVLMSSVASTLRSDEIDYPDKRAKVARQ